MSTAYTFFLRLHPNTVLSPIPAFYALLTQNLTTIFFFTVLLLKLIWVKLFHLINLSWVVPSSIPSLTSQWRSFPLSRQPNSYETCAFMLYFGPFVKKGTQDSLKTFMEISLLFEILLYLVASWAKPNCTFSCIPFDIFFCIWGASPPSGDSPLIPSTPSPFSIFN